MIASNKPAQSGGEPAADLPVRHGPSRAATRFVWGFGVFMVAIAGGGFLFKLIEFITAFTSDSPMQFAIVPVVTYLLVAAGFGCLFIWALLAGQFKDVEAPKYRMLQMQDEFDTKGQ